MSNRKNDDKALIEIEEYRHKEMTNGIAGMFAFLMAFICIILGTQLESYRRWTEISALWYVLVGAFVVIGVICLCFAAYYSKKKDELLKSLRS